MVNAAFAFLLLTFSIHAEPRLFAPGAVSSAAFELTPAFSPDARTCYFIRHAAGMKYPTIMESRSVDGVWSAAKPVPFSGTYRDAPPALSPDGAKLYFASQRPLPGKSGESRHWHIWTVERTPSGWGEPQPAGAPVLDEEKSQSSPSVTAGGTVYYTTQEPAGGWEIYRARPGAAPEKVPHVNTRFDEHWAFISADESLLVYSSAARFDSLGESDLYSARNFDKGRREVELRAFPEPVNSAAEENCPRLSADGKRLLFTRDGDVYEADLSTTAAPDPVWSDAAPMLHARIWPQAAVLSGRIFV
jgi:hypothetical protein